MVGRSYWCIPIMSTFGHHFVLQIAAWKRHLSFSWIFCDVWCLYNGGLGWCSYHDAGCYPRRQWRPTLGSVYSRTVIRILLLFHCTRQLSERYNFGSFDLSSEALLCSVFAYIHSNPTYNICTVGRLFGDIFVCSVDGRKQIVQVFDESYFLLGFTIFYVCEPCYQTSMSLYCLSWVHLVSRVEWFD